MILKKHQKNPMQDTSMPKVKSFIEKIRTRLKEDYVWKKFPI